MRSCCAPEALSFQDSLVAIRMFVTVIPLGMERVSGSGAKISDQNHLVYAARHVRPPVPLANYYCQWTNNIVTAN